MEHKGFPTTDASLAIQPGAVSEIADLARRGLTLEIEGKTFSPLSMKRVIDDPRPEPLELATLTGLIDYVAANVDGLELTECLIHVRSHERVDLVTEVRGERTERHAPAIARLDKVDRFPFGQFIPHEEFCIELRSRFAPTDDLAKVLAIVGTIKIENGVRTEDDGITQKVSVNKTISGALVAEKPAPVSVILRPYRTFNDVEQPESEFLFRMRQGKEGAEAALFEADGGKWRDAARQTIKKWLQDQLVGLAAEGIPGVIA